MKIAIPDDNGTVSAHFGRCPKFTVLELNGKEIISKEIIESNIDTVIAGGMGMRAQELFEQKNIDILLGVSGSVDDTIKGIVEGTLKSGKSSCDPGSGKGYGLEKPECDHKLNNTIITVR